MHRLLTGRLKVEKLTVPIANLPPSLHGIKIVQLSDFHYDGFSLSDDLLEKAIATSNQIQPDLVFLTGDYVTSNPAPIYQLVLQLKHLTSRFGIYAVLGNHDLYFSHSKTTIIRALASIDIHVLWNQIVYPFGSELAIVGFADLRSHQFNPAAVMPQIDARIPRIVLSHNPDTAEQLQSWRVDLQLSGHTHGGQIIIPKIGSLPALLPKIHPFIPQPLRQKLPYAKKKPYQRFRHWEWSQGLHQVGKNLLYVNRGLGTYLPGRLFCRPEITVINLVAQN
ncbi:metallophosphoesterase [Phormidium sp. LEGE 05292]|uniref:metallophosphoesterase n=1 Tax=[Phormidium] sp. LEGE 05292 TaxID=767427 RepID=UPI001883105C|nr:metallophosphoesterase [Phormidium sp. LEGE 05292]MBE9223860.1 metallophosphoesterase [Phormidium sp. LEGE 05292]